MIYDFFFFTLCAFVYAVIIYVFCDGVFRIYYTFILLLGFVFSKKTAGKIFAIIFNAILSRAYTLSYKLLYTLLLPLKFLSKQLYRLLRPIYDKILVRCSVAKHNRRTKRIIKATDKALNKLISGAKNCSNST